MSTAILEKSGFHTEETITSVSQKKWMITLKNETLALQYQHHFGLPYAVASLLADKNYALEEAENFLYPKLKNLMPSPYLLQDMKKATEFIGDKILQKHPIGVFGDYDVDGGTSSAIMKRYFDMVQIDSFVHIPDRMVEGYGPNIEAFRLLKSKGASCLITVDCGSSAADVMLMAQAESIDTVIIDHHLTYSETAGAVATVNPNRQDDISGLNDLTAAGVSFLFCVTLTQYLRDKNYFIDHAITPPDLLSLLDLVALGTVCDVAPLTGLNRAFVSQGLKIMQAGKNIGLQALAQVGRITQKFSSYHCGFVLGPRVNAGGRIGRADAGFELLTTSCEQTAFKLATELDIYNQERKTIEDMIKEQAIAQVEEEKLHQDAVIIVADFVWHPGVVGIVASRIKELYSKPCFILGGDGDGYKGSGRSISGVDLGTYVKKAHENGIILAGGGHKMAAGLSLEANKLQQLRAFFNKHLNEAVAIARTKMISKIDAVIPASGVNLALHEAIEQLAPFGVGNPSPTFCIEKMRVAFVKKIGENHLRLKLRDKTGVTIEAVCFRCLDTPLGDILQDQKIDLNIIGTMKPDTYHHTGGMQFIIEDVF